MFSANHCQNHFLKTPAVLIAFLRIKESATEESVLSTCVLSSQILNIVRNIVQNSGCTL